MSGVADILERLGENAAQSRLQRGQILGGVVAGAAQVPGQIYAAQRQQRLDALHEAQVAADLSFKKAEGDRADAQAKRQAVLDQQTLQKMKQEQADRDASDAAIGAYVQSPTTDPNNPRQHDPQAGIDALTKINRQDLVPHFLDFHQAQADKPIILKEGERGVNPRTFQPIAGMEGAPKPPTAEQDTAQYLNIQARKKQGFAIPPAEQAWADAYEQNKTLATDKSAGAAADRQTAAITAAAASQARTQGAATAQQQRAQDFTALQAARGDLEKNVNTPYTTAKTSANTLRDVVEAAQHGNTVAASLQALETTMAAIRAQGLNRINSAEIGVSANAGSLFQNIAGWLGKKAEGRPMPASVQKDMLDFAGIIEKAAYKKYQTGHKAVNDLYGTKIPELLTAPESAATPAPALTPGLAGLAGRK